MTTTADSAPDTDEPLAARPGSVAAVTADTVHMDALTGRQREILELLAAGVPSKQVARHLGVSRRTIDKHMEVAYRTLGVTTRIQALRAVGHLDRGGNGANG